jgi:hypothetical protein
MIKTVTPCFPLRPTIPAPPTGINTSLVQRPRGQDGGDAKVKPFVRRHGIERYTSEALSRSLPC